MPEQQSGERDSGQERAKRYERAERILDAAATLIQRWGYAKTTLNDIARQARVSKATIYQHWKTREDLLEALLAREYTKVAEDMRQRMEADPEGKTLRGFARYSMLAVVKNPLVLALMSRNTEMLGKWADQAYGNALYIKRRDDYKRFLEILRAQGIIGADMDIYAQTYILTAIWTGFLTANTWIPAEFRFSNEAIAEMLAETVQRTLAPQQAGPNAANTPETASIFSQYMDQERQNIQEMHKEKNL